MKHVLFLLLIAFTVNADAQSESESMRKLREVQGVSELKFQRGICFNDSSPILLQTPKHYWDYIGNDLFAPQPEEIEIRYRKVFNTALEASLSAQLLIIELAERHCKPKTEINPSPNLYSSCHPEFFRYRDSKDELSWSRPSNSIIDEREIPGKWVVQIDRMTCRQHLRCVVSTADFIIWRGSSDLPGVSPIVPSECR